MLASKFQSLHSLFLISSLACNDLPLQLTRALISASSVQCGCNALQNSECLCSLSFHPIRDFQNHGVISEFCQGLQLGTDCGLLCETKCHVCFVQFYACFQHTNYSSSSLFYQASLCLLEGNTRSSCCDREEMNPTTTMRLWVPSLASLSGLRIRCCSELWCRSQTHGLDPVLL